MTQPTPYSRSYGFTDWSAAHPSDPHPGTALDAEFNALGLTLGQFLANLAVLQRDDGLLGNATVHPESLTPATLELISAVGPVGPQGPTGPAGSPGAPGATVSSVSLSLPASLFDVGAAVTTSGTLTGTLKTQAPNKILAGPASGADAAPTMRTMVAADVPDKLITLAKQADMATGSVVYRKTAGAGPPEVQTLAQLKTDLGLSGTNSGDQAVPVEATNAQGWTGTDAADFISPRRLFAMSANVAVAYAATVTLDFNTGINFAIAALTGNLTLANPTNMKSGQSGKIRLTQDGTGSRIISYGANWRFAGGKAVSGVLSTAANAIDHLTYFVEEDGTITATLAKAFS